MPYNETFSQLSTHYAELYPKEHEAERLLDEAQIVAREVAAEHPFESREQAENYINNRIRPILTQPIPHDVVFEASGEGLSIPKLDAVQMSEIPGVPAELANGYALICSGMRPHTVLDAPVEGHLREIRASVTENDDSKHEISLEAVIDPISGEQGKLHQNVKVYIVRSADVALRGTAHIATRRLNQLRRVQGLVATSSQHETAMKLAAVLCRLDGELLNADASAYKVLSDIKLLRYAGGLAAKMMKNADTDTSQRAEIIDIITNGLPLVDRPVLFSCDKPILARPIISEELDPENHWIPVTLDGSDQPGKIAGVVDCLYAPDTRRMPKHVPHVVIETAVPEHKKHILCFAPMPRISRFSY